MEFRQLDLGDAELDEIEGRYAPLAEAVRELIRATILSTAGDDVVAPALAAVRSATSSLNAEVDTDHAGVNYNSAGRSWSWGNAGNGLRNPVAPPIEVIFADDGSTHAELDLGPAYEGLPGCVHGGVAALLLDHLMGFTASGLDRVTFTATLTLHYRNPLPLGPVRLDGRIAREEGRKVHVAATITGEAGTAIEAEGLFIVPKWSPDFEATQH